MHSGEIDNNNESFYTKSIPPNLTDKFINLDSAKFSWIKKN